MVGNDVEERGGISFGVIDAISEIWSIGNGAPPQLLDRQHKLIPDGVHTQAEVSTYQPPLPEIIGSGY